MSYNTIYINIFIDVKNITAQLAAVGTVQPTAFHAQWATGPAGPGRSVHPADLQGGRQPVATR